MNKPLSIAASVAVVALVGVSVVRLQNNVLEVQKRFPDIDPKIVEKAYYTMLRKSFSGQYDQDLREMDNRQMDQLFLLEVDRLSNHNK